MEIFNKFGLNSGGIILQRVTPNPILWKSIRKDEESGRTEHENKVGIAL